MTAQPGLTIRYAATDQDVVAIHRFLCITMMQLLPGPIDPKDSAIEVWRVVNHDLALMAMRGELLVGTMGIIRPTHWWNGKLPFLANRWLSVLPDSKAFKPLLHEARAIAAASELELHVYDETKGRIVIFNKSKNRHVLRKLDHHAKHREQQHDERQHVGDAERANPGLVGERR